MTTTNTITFEDLKDDYLYGTKGKELLIINTFNGFKFSTFSKLEDISFYTYKVELEMDNNSELIIDVNTIENIFVETELSRNNTQIIQLELINGQQLHIEYEV